MEQVSLVLDCWESQSYWALTGWSAPVGQPHYWIPALNLCGDFLPESLMCPSNWEWSDGWSVDRSMTFGQPDEEGWFYALTFDRLAESLKQKRGIGQSSKMLVRRRRHLRPLHSSFDEVVSLINHRKENVVKIKAVLESCITEKVRSLSFLDTYDDNRLQLQKESLRVAVEGFENIIAFLLELAGDMKTLSQVLSDYASIEMDHAYRLNELGVKYSPKGFKSPPPPTAAAAASVSATRKELPVAAVATLEHNDTTNHPQQSTVVLTHLSSKVSNDRPTKLMSTPTRLLTSTARPTSNRFFSSIGSSLMMTSSKAIMHSFQGTITTAATTSSSSTSLVTIVSTPQDPSHGDAIPTAHSQVVAPHSTNVIISPVVTSSIESDRSSVSTVNDADSTSLIRSSITTTDVPSSSHHHHHHHHHHSDNNISTSREKSKMDAVLPNETTLIEASTSPSSSPSSSSPTSSMTRIFFDQLSAVTNKMADQIKLFASTLRRSSESDDLLSLVQQIHAVVVEAKANLQRNRDLFHLCEIASKKRFDLAVTVHKLTIYQVLSVIKRLDEELTVLQGGLSSTYSSSPLGASHASNRSVHFYSSSSSSSSSDAIPLEVISFNANTFTGSILFETSIGVKQSTTTAEPLEGVSQDHHDVWLCMHHYKEAVRDSQESLSILVADYMDVEFHQQILSNKAHNIFIELSSHYVNEQLVCWRELSSIFDSMIHKRMLSTAIGQGMPYPDLDSPFTKINFGMHPAEAVHSMSTLPSTAKPTTNNNNYSINYDHCLQQCGLFSFTQLYHISQPKSSCIALSGPIMISKVKAVDSRRKGIETSTWSTAFALATIDGFLHILDRSKHELPALTYYIKNCELNPFLERPESGELSALILHIVPRSEVVIASKLGIESNQEIYLRCESEMDCKKWKAALMDPLSVDGGLYADEDVEGEVHRAMNNSISILRGEANSVSSSLLQYQESKGGASALQSFLNSSYRTSVKKNTEDNARLIYDDDDDNDGGDDKGGNGGGDAVGETTLDASSISCEDSNGVDSWKSIVNRAVDHMSSDELSTRSESYVVTGTTSMASRQSRSCNSKDDESKLIASSSPPPSSSSSSSSSSSVEEDSTSLSKHSKKDASWIKRLDALDNISSSSSNSIGLLSPAALYPTDHLPQDFSGAVSPSPSKAAASTPIGRPKQLIPVIDRSVPLALKHSNMIDQYEQGLKAEREKTDLRVRATRDVKLKEAVMASGNDPALLNETGDDHHSSVAIMLSTPKKKKKVLSMTSLFEAVDESSARDRDKHL